MDLLRITLAVSACSLLHAVSAEEIQQNTTTAGLGWWAEWKEWSTCVGQCEWGTRNRSRRCPDDYCPGYDIEYGVCELYVYCIDGDWSAWSQSQAYSECDRSCGGGKLTAKRTRHCLSGEEDARCKGSDVNYTIAECNTHECFLHGRWSSWGEWTETTCSTTCGYGKILKTRPRTCTDPQPSGGGKNCEGDNWQTYQIACRNELECDVTTGPTTTATTVTEFMWINPTVPITVSVLVGVPLFVTMYWLIKALRKTHCHKTESAPVTTADYRDVHDDDENWHLKAKNVPNVRIDLPNTRRTKKEIAKK